MIAALLAQPCLIEQVEGSYVVEPLQFIPITARVAPADPRAGQSSLIGAGHKTPPPALLNSGPPGPLRSQITRADQSPGRRTGKALA